MSTEDKANVIVTLNGVKGGVFADYTSGLFEPRAFEEGTRKRYSMSLIVTKKSEAFQVLSQSVAKVMSTAYGEAEWKEKYAAYKNNSGKCFFIDTVCKNNPERYKPFVEKYGECIVISANKYADQGMIGVFDAQGNPVLSREANLPAPGDLVVARFSIWVQKLKTPGLRAQAINIQYAGKSGLEMSNGSAPPSNMGIAPIQEVANEDFGTAAESGLM